ncbi:MAG: hypothetical protein ACE5EO_00840 [Candidatus Krumholzibacteriia bacterium]
MKKVILLTTVMLFGASLAFGQAGVIGTYGDPGAADCNVVDAAPGLLSIFVVHTLSPGASASQFRAQTPLCMSTTGAVYLSDTAVYAVTVGNSQTGVAIGYGTCVASPNHVLTINYFASGSTPLCCAFVVDADPNVPSGEVEVVDCANNLLIGAGRTNTVNGTPQNCDCNLIPVEESTWGQVKSLYE